MITKKDLHKKVIIKVGIKEIEANGCFGRIQSIVSNGEYAIVNINKQSKAPAGGIVLVSADEIELINDEFHTGLPHDVKRAQKYVGKVMEFSDDGSNWYSGILEYACNRPSNSSHPHYKYKRSDVGWYIYCRTCPETFKPEKKYIEFPAGKLPAPERIKPKNGTIYFHLSHFDNKGFKATEWTDYEMDNNAFKNGIWLKEADIQQVAEWWRKTFGQVEAVG